MSAAAVQAALRSPNDWQVRHVQQTRSTNDDLARGTPESPQPVDGMVLVTEEQTAGRGRSGRDWSCPPGAGLMFSAKVAMGGIPPQRRAWIGVALGLAVLHGFSRILEVAGPTATLKWPNDVLVGGRKCGGILAEAIGESVVVGAGLNISLQEHELPRADATSLVLAGVVEVNRNLLLATVLDHFGELLADWRRAGGDVGASGLRVAYLRACSTLGSAVRLELPGDTMVTGTAVDVDADGAIVVEALDGSRSRYSAGDVVHLRPAA
ncbi:BirA family biotin operon repressor/biotin-[acetyl-CoA-carboxylase] ligase [Nakamurella sp. UYEF19]